MGNTPNNNFPFPESTDLVKDGAQAIEDLADAIDTTLGVYAPSTPGLTLINTTSFSGVTSVSLPANTFTATYDNYLIKFNQLLGSTDTYAGIRMRASGVDDSGANYRRQTLNAYGTVVDGARTTGSTSFLESVRVGSTFSNDADMTLCNPFVSGVTSAISRTLIGSNGDIEFYQRGFGLNTATSYDSLTLIKVSGTFTGSISVYGFSK
jgi:hypothetical protein